MWAALVSARPRSPAGAVAGAVDLGSCGRSRASGVTSPTSGSNAKTDTGVPRAGGAEVIEDQHPLLRCSARAEQGSRWVVVRKNGRGGAAGPKYGSVPGGESD
jgi:hypothetical protein